MGEEFRYAYLTCAAAIIRIKIPMTPLNGSSEHDLELAFYNKSRPLPYSTGLFSLGHIVYMVGGHTGYDLKYACNKYMYMFDPANFDQFPVKSVKHILRLDKPKFVSMMAPCVIRAGNRIYFLSKTDYPCQVRHVDGPLIFQSFDPTRNIFRTHPPPPLLPLFPPSPDISMGSFSLSGHFFLSGYIYVCIVDTYGSYRHIFAFNTMSSKWEDRMFLLDRFKEKNIPFPLAHFGDIGLSEEWSDNTRIFVALKRTQPIAYYVHLRDGCDIEPISCRVLDECHVDVQWEFERFSWARLFDMGRGRFCVIHKTSPENYRIYVFRINFALERDIQISSGSGVRNSVDIIFSKTFNPDDITPEKLSFTFTSFCMAFAPPSSPSNEDGNKNNRKMKSTISDKRGSVGNKGMHKGKSRCSS